MNQEPGDFAATYLGLQGFDVVAVERVQHPERGRVKVVRVERREGQHECPDCGRRHAAGLFAEVEPIRLRDLLDRRHRDVTSSAASADCLLRDAGGAAAARMPGFRMTHRFFERLAALCTRLQEWILAMFDTELQELDRVAHRIARHLEAVIAGCEHDVPLGLVEAIYGKIAVLRRQARGYRDPEFFKLKILQRCGLPHNPWATIVL